MNATTTVTINGKTIPFAKATVAFVRAITENEYEETLTAKLNDALKSNEGLEKFNREWKRFCLIAFKRRFWWYIALPRYLRFSNVTLTEGARTIKTFFVYVAEILSELSELSKPSGASATQK